MCVGHILFCSVDVLFATPSQCNEGKGENFPFELKGGNREFSPRWRKGTWTTAEAARENVRRIHALSLR